MFRIDLPLAEKHRKAVQKARNYARRQTERRLAEYTSYDYAKDPNESWRRQMVYLDAVGAEIILNMYHMASCLPPFWHTNSVEIWYQNSPFDDRK